MRRIGQLVPGGELHKLPNCRPLPGGSDNSQLFFDKVVGKTKPSSLLAASNNEGGLILDGNQFELFSLRLQRQSRRRRGWVREKSDAQHRVVIDRGSFEGVLLNQRLQVGHSFQNYVCLVSECLAQLLFNFAPQGLISCCFGLEDNVAALYVGPAIPETQAGETFNQ